MFRKGLASIAVVALGLSTATAAHAQQISLGDQIIFGGLNQATADPAFETQMFKQLGAVAAANVGFTGGTFLLKKDRGPHGGLYAALVTEGPYGEGHFLDSFAKALPTTSRYQLIGGLKPSPTVDILAVHYIKVRPDRSEAFEKFVADKLNPTLGKLRPDLRLVYYREGLLRPAAPNYICIFAVTRASRDKYWPNGSDSDDLKAAFTPQIKALATELETYLVPDSFGVGMTAAVFEAKDWADWGIAEK